MWVSTRVTQIGSDDLVFSLSLTDSLACLITDSLACLRQPGVPPVC